MSLIDDEFTLDGIIGYVSADKKWGISLWGKNITDELNVSSHFSLVGSTYRNHMAPGTFGIAVRY